MKDRESPRHLTREAIEAEEPLRLSRGAALSCDHRRPHGLEDDHRLPYKRDVDRIIHSRAYARYVDKTQVVYLIDNDHVTQRGLHVQLVSNFARGVAEILRLNVDLVEAIALGHDVGHPPFGHEGEGYLSEISKEAGLGPFSHAAQSCRLFDIIEPLNLGELVYDGFLSHDGGMKEHCLVPAATKSWEEHLADRKNKSSFPDLNLAPASLEGCLVKLCDTISYLGRDIEDAIHLGIISRKEIPKNCLGTTNREILSALAQTLIAKSSSEAIALSEETYEALWILRSFNFEKIYSHKGLKTESHKIQRAYSLLFNALLSEWKSAGRSSVLWSHFLHSKRESYLEETADAQLVIDFIAGMTNHFFLKIFDELIVPQTIRWDQLHK